MKTRYLFFLMAGMWLMSASLNAQGTWTQKANYAGIERWGVVSFSIGTKGYIVTGARYDGGFYNCQKDLWEYDPATNIWSQKADFGGVGRYAGTGFSIGTKGYVGWGLTSPFSYINDFWEYNSITNVWTQKADLGANGSRESAVGFSIGSKGYMGTGGNHNISYGYRFKDFWEYDPATDVWTKKAHFGGEARGGAVGLSIGLKGYIGTGIAETEALNDFWEYDPTNNSWTKKADFAGGVRIAAVGFSIGSKGYIGTGYEDAWFNLKSDFWEYSVENDTWTQKANCDGLARGSATGFSIGTKGYIGCGNINGQEQTNDFWEYMPDCTIEDFTVTIEIPGAFTPNNDNINDYFAISFRNIKTADVWIKDQWGVLIKKFDGVNEQWDGLTESGKEAPSAPYFYIVSAVDLAGKGHERDGVVYLVRDLVELYPNPAIKSINVETNGRIPGERDVKIYSSKGDLMLESKTTSDRFDFDVSQFMPGIYFVHISNGNEVSITKFIKQ